MSDLKVVQQAIQEAINTAITSPDYKPPLPVLDDEVWNTVFDWQNHYFSNNCLEWLGDGLMYAAISVELYRQVPMGNPHMYTMIRTPIVTNQTFALLTNKLNISGSLRVHASKQWQIRSPTHKCYADLFEVMPAEVYLRGGFDVLRQWVAKVFEPLIKAAVVAYNTLPFPLNKKRKRIEEYDPPTLTGMASCRVNKRQKTVNTLTADGAQKSVPSSVSKVTTDVFSNPPPRPVKPLPHGRRADQARSSGYSLHAPNATPNVVSPSRSRGASSASSSVPSRPLPATAAPPSRDIATKKSAGKPSALPERLRSTIDLASESIQSDKGSTPRRPRPSGNHRSLITAHWVRALGGSPESGPSGLQAVLSSPSRYIAALPSAPACGPGSSRFDPIVIDDDVEDDADNASGPRSATREVIELSDDDESTSPGIDEDEVMNLLVPLDPARIAKESYQNRTTRLSAGGKAST